MTVYEDYVWMVFGGIACFAIVGGTIWLVLMLLEERADRKREERDLHVLEHLNDDKRPGQ